MVSIISWFKEALSLVKVILWIPWSVMTSVLDLAQSNLDITDEDITSYKELMK